MSTLKTTLFTVALAFGAVAPVLAIADPSAPIVGRVIRVHDNGIEMKLSHHEVPTVGAVYGVSREIHYGPKVAIYNQTRRVGHVRVVALLDNGRARAEVVDGSIWAGDNLTQNGGR